MFKRVLSLFLSIVMVFSLMPVSAFATENETSAAEETVTESTPTEGEQTETEASAEEGPSAQTDDGTFGQEEFDAVIEEKDGFYWLMQDMTITSDVTFDGGVLMLLAHNGPGGKSITIADGATLTISGSSTVPVQNGGSITVEAGGKLVMAAGTYLDVVNDGSLTVKAGGSLVANGAHVGVNSAGSMTVETGADLTVDSVNIMPGAAISGVADYMIRIVSVPVSSAKEMETAMTTYAAYGGLEAYTTGDFSLPDGMMIPAGMTLAVVNGYTVTIDENVTVTNEGTILVAADGTLLNRGTLAGNGILDVQEGGNYSDGTGTEDTSGIAVDEINFPDTNFRAYILEQEWGMDGVLTEEEIAGITEIDCCYRSITNLQGIEYFTELTTLNCAGNYLTSLDVSNNIALLDLNCTENQLTSLDVSSNTSLRYLACYSNQLTSLNVKNAPLTNLVCRYNQLTSLDVSTNTELEYLELFYNKLTSLDVSNNTKLTVLDVGFNQISSLNLGSNNALELLSCYGNRLTNLDLSQNSLLTSVDGGGDCFVITLDANNQYNLTNLPGCFDVSKSGNWTGGTVSGTILTASNSIVSYTYDVGYGDPVSFTLVTAPDTIAGGACGEDAVWLLYSDGTLTISGSGTYETVILDNYIEQIETVVIEEGITSLASGGPTKFAKCVIIAGSVSKIQAYSLGNYDSTQEITFLGNAPSFAESAFMGATATVYYPAGNETWTSDVMQNYGGTITWVAYQEDNSVSSLDALKAAIDAGETNIVVSDSIICGPEDTLTIPENVTVEIPDGAALLLNGTVNIAGTVVNHGSLWVNMNSVTTLASTGNITNYGNIHVGFGDGEYSSTLNIAGEVISYGYFNVTDHGTVNVTGTLSNQMNGPEAGFIDLKGKLIVTGTLMNQSGPSITVEGGTLDVSNGTYSGMFPVTVFLSSTSTSISGINGNMLNYCYRVTDQDSLMAAIDAAKAYGHINAEMNTGFTLTESVTLSNMMLTIYGTNGNPVELTVADGVTLTNNAEIRIGIDATLTVAEGGTLHNNRSVTVANGTVNVAGSYTSDYEDVAISIDLNACGTVSGAPYRVSGSVYDYNGLKNALALSESYAQIGVDITVENSVTIAEDMEIPAYVTMHVSGNPYNKVTLVVPYGVTLTNHGNLEINCAELAVHSGGKLINNGELAFNAMPHGFGGGSLGGEFVNNGSLWVNTGATVDMGGSTTNYGNIHVGFGEGQTCTLNINGDLTNYGYLNLTEYGKLNVNGTLNVVKEGDYSGFLQDGGTVDVFGTLNVSALCTVGNESNNARLYVAENGTMNVTDTEIEIAGGEMGVDGVLNAVNSGIINNGLLAINRSGEANIDENSGIINNNTLHVGMGPEDEEFRSVLNVNGFVENYGYFCVHPKGYVSIPGEMSIYVDEEHWGFLDITGGEVEVSGKLSNDNAISVAGSLRISGTYEGDGPVNMYCEYGRINVTGVPNSSIDAEFGCVMDAATLLTAVTSGYKTAHVEITGNITLTESLTIPAGSSIHIADYVMEASAYSRSLLTSKANTCASLTVPEGMTLTIEGNLSNDGEVIVEQSAELVNKEEGVIENSGSLIIQESAELVNEGDIENVGSMVVETNAALVNNGAISTGSGTVLTVSGTYSGEGNVNANMMNGTVVEGIDNASLNVTDEVSGEDELRELLNSGYNGGSIYVSNEVTLTADLTIPEGYMVYLTEGGSITVPAEKKLTISGSLQQLDNTAVTVEAGGELEVAQKGFYNVQSGTLTVDENATVTANENLAFINGGGIITGVVPERLIIMSFVGDTDALEQAIVDGEGYQYSYLHVAAEDFILERSVEIPENAILSLSGMEESPVSLTIPEDVTLTNNGIIEVYEYGSVVIAEQGAVVNNGQIEAVGGNVAVEEGGKLQGSFPNGIDIAVAAIGDTQYATVSEALAAAKSGETVKLVKDADVNDVIVRGGITLDLNGNTLTAEYVFAVKGSNIVDNSADNTGVLKVDADHAMIHTANAQLPVWNGEGYVFTTVEYKTKLVSSDSDSLQFAFLPQFKSGATALLEDGVDGNKVTIEVRVSWLTTMGREYRNLVFNENQVDTVVGTNGAFILTFSGFSQLSMASGISVEGIVISETGVNIASEATVVDVTNG